MVEIYSLAIDIDLFLPDLRVIRSLEQVIKWRAKPDEIRALIAQQSSTDHGIKPPLRVDYRRTATGLTCYLPMM